MRRDIKPGFEFAYKRESWTVARAHFHQGAALRAHYSMEERITRVVLKPCRCYGHDVARARYMARQHVGRKARYLSDKR
jgi:hydroxyacyl-ACP dehydratase HTD2-like protein with hotdog domain